MPISFVSKPKHLVPELSHRVWFESSICMCTSFCALPKWACMQNTMCCQAEHIMRGAYLIHQEIQHFRSFFVKFICCTDIPCSKDCATSWVGAWESKSLPSPGDELHISLTDRAASRWDMGWGQTHGYGLLYLPGSLRGRGTMLCSCGE